MTITTGGHHAAMRLITWLPLAAGWSTCSFPHVDWMTADVGAGKSATQKVAGVGNFAYMGGYATGTTTLQSTASTSVRGRARVRTLRVRMHICER